jgi:hypothetical protein
VAKINIDNFANEVMQELNAYRDVTVEAMKKAVTETAKLTVAELRDSSPEDTGEYSKHWSYKRDADIKGRYKYSMVVYSKKPEYRITHLLENGHAKRNGGRVEGKPHIKPAEKHAKEILSERIERYI